MLKDPGRGLRENVSAKASNKKDLTTIRIFMTRFAAERILLDWPFMQSYSPLELSDLIAKAKSGCRESLGELLSIYRSYLRLVVSLQIDKPLQEKVSASDLVQATCLKAQKGIGDFAGNSERELIAWLRKILISQLLNELRRYSTLGRDLKLERKLNARSEQSSMMLGSILAAPGRSPSESAVRRERAVLLAEALSQLPEDYREIIVLRHLRSMQFSDIAEQTNRTIDSVKGIWRRAIAQLRTHLGNETI